MATVLPIQVYIVLFSIAAGFGITIFLTVWIVWSLIRFAVNPAPLMWHNRLLNFISVPAFVIVITLMLVYVPPTADRLVNPVTPSADLRELLKGEAQNLHPRLDIVDLHCDTLMWSHRNLNSKLDYGQVDLPRLREGNVAIQAFTIVTSAPLFLNFESNPNNSAVDLVQLTAILQRWPLKSVFSRFERAIFQTQRLHSIAAESNGMLRIIKSKQDVHHYLHDRAKNTKLTAGFLGIEGLHSLEGKLENVDKLFQAGVRMMGPSHFFDNEVCGSSQGEGKYGLTAFRKKVISRMEQLKIFVDVAHTSKQCLDDIIQVSTRPIMCSHSGLVGRKNNSRNMEDRSYDHHRIHRHLKAIQKSGGVVGIAYFKFATGGEDVMSIVQSLVYAIKLIGSDHVSLGSDYDGTARMPLDTSHLAAITQGLANEGLREEYIKKVMGGSAMQFLQNNLPETDS